MKYICKLKLEGIPEIVVGETETNTPFQAGLKLQDALKARVGEKKFGLIESATIVDETGKDAAILQIDTRTDNVTGKTTRTPRWNSWLTFRTAK